MATETVRQPEPALEAFAGYEQGVFLEWMAGLSDLVMCIGQAGLAHRTLPAVGGLMFALTLAAEELGRRERETQR